MTVHGTDSSLYFDNDLLKSGLTDALMSSMEAAPTHLGDIIDRRSHGDHMGDGNSLWIMGDESYFNKRTGDKGANDKLGLYKSPFTVEDYYKLVRESKNRMRREQTGMLEAWVRGIGKTYFPGQEAEALSVILTKLDLEGNSVIKTGFDGLQLYASTHLWNVAGSSHATHPDQIGVTHSNDLELPALLSDTVTAGTVWSKLAVDDAWALATRTIASWRTDKNRPFNFVNMSQPVVLYTPDDTGDAGLVTSIEAAFDTNYRVGNDTDQPYKGRATLRPSPFVPAARSDRLYFHFAPMGTDGTSRVEGQGGIVIVDNISPEMVDVENIQGDVSVGVDAAHGFTVGQWWKTVCVRLNGTAASDA